MKYYIKPTVLIVDNEPIIVKLIRDILTQSGYDTLEATNGKQGVALAIKKKPDLILMDIQMPVMDGLQATRILKGNAQTRKIPIIAVTAYAMKGDVDKILKAGCDACLAKPFGIRAFLETVAQYLPESTAAPIHELNAWNFFTSAEKGKSTSEL